MQANGPAPLPMTHLESMLKRCYDQRPDIQGRILQPEELADYIGWMIETFSDDPAYRIDNDPIPGLSGSEMGVLGRRIIDNPHDSKAVLALASGYRTQQEDRYIVSEHDISVGRMLRYMPSHWHRNNYFEVYYAFSGECPIAFQNEEVIVRPGTILIVAPGVVHASPCFGDDRVLMYYMLRSSTFDQVFWSQLPSENLMSRFFRMALDGTLPNAYLQFDTGDDGAIRELLFQIAREFDEGLPYSSQIMNSLMTTCFVLLLRSYEGTARLPRSEDFFWKHEFSAVLSYIQTHYADARIEDVARRFHYSERQITRIVRRCTEMSYAELVNRLRMEAAAKALGQSGATIEEISQRVGYSNVSSFYRSFERYFGCTPARYRGNPT